VDVQGAPLSRTSSHSSSDALALITAAAVDHGAARALQQRHRAADLPHVRLGARAIGAVRFRRRRRVGRGGDQHVLRQVDHHRAGPPAGRDREGLVHDARQVLAPLDQVIVLGRRAGDAGRVRLLKRVVADQVRRNLSRQTDDGDAVHQRVDQPGDGVGGTRAAGDQHDANLAGGAGIAFGGVHRRLLVANQDVADRVLVEDSVIDRQHRTTRIAENHLDALVLEGLEQDFSAGTAGGTVECHGSVLRVGPVRVNRQG
jgi:hypothetical protein